jgi:hypothetical protein
MVFKWSTLAVALGLVLVVAVSASAVRCETSRPAGQRGDAWLGYAGLVGGAGGLGLVLWGATRVSSLRQPTQNPSA